MPALFKQFEHIITQQYKQEEAFLQDYQKGDYTFEKPFIKVNPYSIAPLTALIMFETPEEVSVTLTVKGKEAAGDMFFTYPKAKSHVLQVLGLYGGYKNTVVMALEKGGEKVLDIQTQALDEKVKQPTKIETTAEYLGNQVIFVSPTTPAMTTAYDYKGDARWYVTLNLSFDIKRAKNGRLLMGTERLVSPPYHTTGLYELGMIGKIYKEFRLPSGYHHDQFEMENGDLLILTQDLPRGTVEDMCVLVDRKTGQILKTWDYQKVLPTDKGGSGSQDTHDWFHNNAVWYDKKTNSLSFSGRHQDIVINLDYETGELNWILGDPEGWPQEMVDKYFFTPVGEGAFDWQYEQHACVIVPNGDVMVFDNGHYRSKVKENYIPAQNNFSRGVRYKIDTDAMTIEQVWQFGKERGVDFFSCYISNVEYYGEGHYMVHSGGMGTINGIATDIPPAGLVAQNIEGLALNSVTLEIKDDQIMYEMHLPANYYRAEKLSLYCEADTLCFGKGELLGGLGVSEEMETEVPAEQAQELPEKYNVRIGEEEDRLILKASFEKGQLVMLMFEGETVHRYFVPTTKRPFLAMCVGTFQDSDERAVQFPVSKEGLKGNFKITLIIDDKKYDTGIEVSC